MSSLPSFSLSPRFLLLVAAAISAVPAAGKDKNASQRLAALLECRALADSAGRLACFDREAGDLATNPVELQASGEDRIDNLESAVRTATATPFGKYRLTLEDGTVWMQVDGAPMREPRPGQRVTISSGALGSYMAKVEGGRAFRVRRER